MTLARTALRLATLNALQGANAASGPTIARNRVFDSRISDLAPENFVSDAKPVIIVLTDEDAGEAMSDQNGGPPFERNVNLVVEFAMIQTFDVKDALGQTTQVIDSPATDAELEAALDMLEFQIVRRMAYDPDPSGVLWRQVARVWKYDCHRQVVDDSGVKIAARILTWECEVEDDRVDIINPEIHDIPIGLNALPEPLRSVALALPLLSSARVTCEKIAAALPALQVDPLEGIDFKIRVGDQVLADMLDMTIDIASAQDVPTTVASGAPVVLDYARGMWQHLILAANVTAIEVKNWPRVPKPGRLILKVTNTGNFNIAPTAWPAGYLWVAGDPPAITQGANKQDLLALVTGTAGAEVLGNIIGQDYQA